MSEIVIMVSSLPALVARKISFVFTDRHAYLQTAGFFTDLARLDCIAWDLLQTRDFKTRSFTTPANSSVIRPRRWCIGTCRLPRCRASFATAMRKKLSLLGEIEKRRQTLQVPVKPNWYF